MAQLFDDYFEYVAGGETPQFYHRWCLIAGVGAMLARNVRFPLGHGEVFPNNYIMLLGSPGTRKSTAINTIKKLMHFAGYEHFAGNKSSKEKFLEDLAGIDTFDEMLAGGQQKITDVDITRMNLFGADDADDSVHEMFIAVDEFTNFVGTGNYDFISLLGEFWDNLAAYKARVKNSRSPVISQPTVSLLSGNTAAGFAAAFPPEMIGQGFMSRMLLIHGERTDVRYAWPSIPSAESTNRMVDRLKAIRNQVHGEATFTATAKAAMDRIYTSWPDLEDVRFKHYSSRRFTHLLKLCIICAAMDLRTEICLEDVVLANTILTYTEYLMPQAMGEFGKSSFSSQNNTLLQHLSEASSAVSMKQLWVLMQQDLRRTSELHEMVANLIQANKIMQADGGFLLKKQEIKRERLFVDYNLMSEVGEHHRD